ncbi:MAG: hypothetical protein FWH55_07655 [Oscillospiraceae bacterium]|nr:hypothetical protein [Oscillospiraceae bacterium]
MKWLHVSDQHFSPKTSSAKEQSRNQITKTQLFDYLERAGKEVNKLFITGDFCFARDLFGLSSEELKETAIKTVSFIRDLVKKVHIHDISSHVYVVPGNNNLTRSEDHLTLVRGNLSFY